MYKITIDGGFIYPDEPQLGKFPDEEELREDYVGEIVDAIEQVASDEEEYPEYITMIDSISGEQIDILVEDYISHHTVRGE